MSDKNNTAPLTPSQQIPTRSFYSSRKSKRELEIAAKLDSGESSLKKKPLPPDFKPSLLHGPPKVWQVFHKQDEALRFAKERGEGLMTFAYEERVPNSQGRRKFMVSHPSHMWAIHSARPAEERCTYEVIPLGAPSKLYFDLEFDRTVQPDKNGPAVVSNLILATCQVLKDLYDLIVTVKDVLVLDASTPAKFSQHLIFQGFVFEDNIHCGRFVRHLVDELREGKVAGGLGPEEQQEAANLCDLAVYTKNRNFRLYLSSKFGKNAPLLVSQTNLYVPARTSSADESLFLASLITHPPESAGIISQLLSFDSDDKDGRLTADRPIGSSSPQPPSSKPSPWTEIDGFISSLVAPSGGSIRQWVYYESTQTVVYLIQGSRYCAVVGRDHKSNQVKYVVNLSQGTFYQSCFDPDCKDSPLRPKPERIPEEHLPWSKLFP